MRPMQGQERIRRGGRWWLGTWFEHSEGSRCRQQPGHPTRVAGGSVLPQSAPCLPASRQNLHSARSEEHTSELQSPCNLVCRLLLEKKKHCTALVTALICTLLSVSWVASPFSLWPSLVAPRITTPPIYSPTTLITNILATHCRSSAI